MSDSPHKPWYPADVEHAARALHARVLENDVTARSELADLLPRYMLEGVRRKWPQADEADMHTAVTDAFVAYWQNPGIYHPEKGALLGFLVMAALGDMRNLHDKHRRYTKRFTEFSDLVANEGGEWEEDVEFSDDTDLEEDVILALRNAELEANIYRLFPDPMDRQVLDLIIQRVRALEIYAKVMQIEHLPLEEQRKMVKRTRDRIWVAANRHRDELLLGSAQASHD